MPDTGTNAKVNYLDSVLDPVLDHIAKLSPEDRKRLSLDELIERTVKEYEEALGPENPLTDFSQELAIKVIRAEIAELLQERI